MIRYSIRPADTIYKLAERFRVEETAILAANPGLNPYNLQVGQIINIPVEYSMAPQVQAPAQAPAQARPPRQPLMRGVSRSELDLINTLRRLWHEHVEHTRMTIIDAEAGLPDLSAESARLMRNADDMAAALRPIYGDANATRFGSLIREHLSIAGDLLNALKSGNGDAAAAAERKWYQNADQIAAFLNQINPHIPVEQFRNMLYTHLALTKAEIQARLRHDFSGGISLYDQIENEALGMADLMAYAIARQFPNIYG